MTKDRKLKLDNMVYGCLTCPHLKKGNVSDHCNWRY